MKIFQNHLPLSISIGIIYLVVSLFFGFVFYVDFNYNYESYDIWDKYNYLLLIVFMSASASLTMFLRFSWSRYLGLLTVGLLLGLFSWLIINEPPPRITDMFVIIVLLIVPLFGFMVLLFNERIIYEFDGRPSKDGFDSEHEDILDAY